MIAIAFLRCRGLLFPFVSDVAHGSAVAWEDMPPAMPVSCGAWPHREQLLEHARCLVSDFAMVARLLTRQELKDNPEARRDWAPLRGNPTWDEEHPREWVDVAAEAKKIKKRVI